MGYKIKRTILALLDTTTLGSTIGAIASYIDWANHGQFNITHLYDVEPGKYLVPICTAQQGFYISLIIALGTKFASTYLKFKWMKYKWYDRNV